MMELIQEKLWQEILEHHESEAGRKLTDSEQEILYTTLIRNKLETPSIFTIYLENWEARNKLGEYETHEEYFDNKHKPCRRGFEIATKIRGFGSSYTFVTHIDDGDVDGNLERVKEQAGAVIQSVLDRHNPYKEGSE